ncbi:hypothetical protein [Ectothiorhodospira mobilis]|uniref:hypothetical protein n=1 Tax=Ectothiorhodospira mobilis TaxID=195064 RepID=UPI001905920A|nr:hypothetical protein [Ectothiorhodospira mobilis]MBK1691949.1 hypothetical protein [Ectothiorhodospira mobilis]
MMHLARLSLDRTPPLWVPLQFMATAPLFAVAFAALLAVEGPDALLSRWTPAMLAATHLLVLGYITMVMFGAMQQLLPVVAGSPVPRERLTSRLIHLGLALGTPLLAAGLAWSIPPALATGGLCVLGAMGLFIVTTSISLWRSPARGPTHTALWLAVAALAVTVTLGAWLALGHLPGLPLPRSMTQLHLAWGLAGWIALLIAGVAYQVVPMFQMTPEYPARFARFHAPGVFILLALVTAGGFLPGVPGIALQTLAAAGLVAALAGFAFITLRLQARRRRRNADVTVAFWRTGLLALPLALSLWGLSALPFTPGIQGPAALIPAWLFLAGFTLSIINGMLYKIVPFLVWLHLNHRLMQSGRWDAPVPNMHQVIPIRHTRLQWWFHLTALAAGTAALLWPPLLYPALLAFALSNTLLSANLWQGIGVFRRDGIRQD